MQQIPKKIKKILTTIYTHDKDKAKNEILQHYKQHWRGIINFIYFANIKKFLLATPTKTKENNTQSVNYANALTEGNFLLPDGIALKLYLKKKIHHTIYNLNGTDFTPYLLKTITQQKTHLAFYTVYDEKIGKKKEDFKKVQKYIIKHFNPHTIKGFLSHYKKRGKDFDFDAYTQSLSKETYDIKVLIVWLWTPFQEIWVNQHKDFFQKHNILVINAGGIFDFRSGFEKRAPKRVRRIKGERLWRFFQNPKKNLGKVLTSLNLFKELM